MKTCPKCGYREHDAWRNHRGILNVTYCDIEELEGFNPELHKEIIAKGPTEKLPLYKHPFIYVFKLAGYVWRMDYEDYKNYGFNRNLTEAPDYQERIRLAQAQTRLPDVLKEVEK